MYYDPEDVMTVLDVSLTDISDTGDNKSSASDSEFDLSNPEAGVATDDEIFVSIHDYLSQNATIRLCKKYQIPLSN